MDEENKKKHKKKPKDESGPTEHKVPWQQKYASTEDIKQMLSECVMLRYNEVRRRTEIHYLSTGPEIRADENGLLTIFGAENGGISDGYHDLSERDLNTLWDRLCQRKPVIHQHLRNIIESDYVPAYHPFRHYLEHLPPWTPEQGNAIIELSLSVNVKGDAEEQTLFYRYLTKWLVAMVASWVEERVVNNTMLVLIGPQGSYKTTWFAHLLPPQLRGYFYTKANASLVSKDDLLALTEYGLVCWEELDTMEHRELDKLKAAMTMPYINERPPYERYHVNRPHLASFCGTGNKMQFLSDTTGTRRWIPFEVDSIESPLETPFDHDTIFAQAYALYRQGFQYWFDQHETEELQRHNERFETAHSELELIDLYYRKPQGAEPRELVSATMALQTIGGHLAYSLSKEKIGQAFAALGFEYKRTARQRGYIAVRRTGAEMEAYRRQMAEEDRQAMTDDTMTAVF